MKNIKLSRDEFRKLFIKPLEDKYGYKAYWSGKEAQSLGLKLVSGGYTGWSYTSREEAPIVLKFASNQHYLFKVVIHEYAHSCLHRLGTEGNKLNKSLKEIEAETVAKNVLEKLGIDYTDNWYIPHFKNKCTNEMLEEYSELNRDKELEILINEISELFIDKVQIVNSLISETKKKQSTPREYKYKVTCTCCNRVWRYKRACKIINRKAENYWCGSCGKEKSKNKLIVEKI